MHRYRGSRCDAYGTNYYNNICERVWQMPRSKMNEVCDHCGLNHKALEKILNQLEGVKYEE